MNQSNLILILAFVALLAYGLIRRAKRPRIKNPRLGLLNLLGPEAETLLAKDQSALAGLFVTAEASSRVTPACDVLFLYAVIGPDLVLNTGQSLRSVIGESGARIVVVASENPAPKPPKPKPGDPLANLVVTVQRDGAQFPRFFSELFTQMKKGRSMPVAWVQLAPQGPVAKTASGPTCMLVLEIGQISF